MTRSAVFRLILVGMTIMAIQRAEAASAVALGSGGHLVTSAGQPTEAIAKYDALSTARKKYGANVRLLASTGRTGYGAIAVARRTHGPGSIITVSLGNRTQAEADRSAIAESLKVGGVWPEVRWRIRG